MAKYQVTTEGGKYLVETEEVKREPQLSQVTPEMYGQVGKAITNPLNIPMPGAERFQQGMGRAIGAGVNAAGFNLPNAIMRKMGVDILPPSTTPEQKAGEFAGTIAGTMVSPITKGAMALGKAPQGSRFLTKVGKGAMGGAVMGGAYTPTEDIVGLPQRAGQAIGGGVIGAIAPVVSTFKRYLNPKNQIKLAEEARNSLVGKKNAMIEKYGKSYDEFIKNREGNVSLQEPLANLIEESDDIVNTLKGNQEVSEALAKGDTNAKKVMNLVETFITNPQNIPSQLTLKEADSIQKYIKYLPSIRNKLQKASKIGFEQVDWTNAERVLINFANDIKSQILNASPEMSLVNREYGNFMNNFKQIRPLLKSGSAITNFKAYDRLDPETKMKMMQILPRNIMEKIITTNRAMRAQEILKWVGGISAAGTIAGGAGRIAFGGHR